MYEQNECLLRLSFKRNMFVWQCNDENSDVFLTNDEQNVLIKYIVINSIGLYLQVKDLRI